MRKTFISIFLVLIIVSFFAFPLNLEAKTLRDMYAELETLKQEMKEEEAKKKKVQNEISKISGEISSATKAIEECENKIEELREQIIELNKEIDKKNIEIETLLEFDQISSGDNIYLEYIFGAQSFEDFIYRSSIVEQISSYNEDLIKEMNALIEENKQLEKKLFEKKKEQERLIEDLKSKLKKANANLSDIAEDHKDAAAQVKAQEDSIKYFKDTLKCEMDQQLSECSGGVPYANGMIRPTSKGSVTSNFGYRVHPITKKYTLHTGVDIGISEGNKVYAAAAGRVASVVKKASCGGNKVYIHHTIGGTNYTTAYLHLQSLKVKTGDIVSADTVVGLSGGGRSTPWDGCSTGAHLHFGLGKGWYTGDGYTSYSKWTNSVVNPRDYMSIPSRWSTRK